MDLKEYLAMPIEELEELLKQTWDSMSEKERLMYAMICKIISWNDTQDNAIMNLNNKT